MQQQPWTRFGDSCNILFTGNAKRCKSVHSSWRFLLVICLAVIAAIHIINKTLENESFRFLHSEGLKNVHYSHREERIEAAHDQTQNERIKEHDTNIANVPEIAQSQVTTSSSFQLTTVVAANETAEKVNHSTTAVTQMSTEGGIIENRGEPANPGSVSVCVENPIGQFTRRASSKGYYSSVSEAGFLTGSGLTDTGNRSSSAACEFQNTYFSSQFFHGMEQLYRCFCWWQANPSKSSVLVSNLPVRATRSKLYSGIFSAMRDVFNVSIVSSYSGPSVKQNLGLREGTAPYGMLGPRSSQTLSTNILQFYGRSHVIQNAMERRQQGVPKVGILNREPSSFQSILNVNDLYKHLVRESLNESLFTLAPVNYLTDYTFLDTIEYFASVDILISPHAQHLVTIAFMPPCGSVMELYPKDHWIPDFFGSLASGAGLSHSYFHLSSGPNQFLSNSAGQQNVCPPIDPIVDAVKVLVDDWRECVKNGSKIMKIDRTKGTKIATFDQPLSTSGSDSHDKDNALQGRHSHVISVCQEDFIGSFTRRSTTSGYYLRPAQQGFLSGAGLSSTSPGPAVCEFQVTAWTHHFVHGMEQLYRCFCWWQSNPSRQPVLVYNQKEGQKSQFYSGYLSALRDVFSVSIVPSHPGPSVKQDMHTRDGLAPFGMLGPQYAQTLSSRILTFYNRSHVFAWAKSRRSSKVPRIGIINRHFDIDRSLLNIKQLHAEIELASNMSSLFTIAPVAYFENSSFLDQIEYYSSVDIVITPHGAQLTSIPFMPPCGSVLELYPKDYFIPNYFGTLASGAGLAHSYIHLSSGPDIYRPMARHQKVCPPVDPIVQALKQLVKDWKNCVKSIMTPQASITHPLITNSNKSPEPECTEDPIGPFTRWFNMSGYYTSPDEHGFLTGPGLFDPSSDSAVCEFQNTLWTNHFPHGMEQIYRCFCWWRANPSKKPVLIYDLNRPESRFTYYAGMFAALQDVFNVTFVTNHTGPSVKQDMAIRDGLAPFGMLGPQYARTLSSRILEFYNKSHVLAENAFRRQKIVPKIGIVNRNKTLWRSLLTVEKIYNELNRLSHNESLFTLTPIKYFETASFLDQVEYFGSVDIVVSPHGAQLTSIAFMPECGSVLEFYPKDYWIPGYFGTLASGTGLSHSYFHLSSGPNQFRNNAREQKLCPPTQPIVDAVLQLVNDWKKCAGKRSSDGPDNKISIDAYEAWV